MVKHAKSPAGRGDRGAQGARAWPLAIGLVGLLALGAVYWLYSYLQRPATSADPVPAPVAAAVAPAPASGPRELNPAGLLAGHSSDWRVARLQGNRAILVIEFPNLREQGAAMNRIAALLEKAGAPRDRVLDDLELQQLIVRNGDNAQTFYQGHDYSAVGLARFYMLARRQGLTLGAQELRLEKELLSAGLLGATAAGLEARGEQALISFSATQDDDPTTPIDEGLDARRRESVLQHELSHGEFFTNAAYREHCWRFWREALGERERAILRKYLVGLDYDPANEELLVNEMQALLMHTNDTRAFNARSVGVSETVLDGWRAKFREGQPTR